MLRASRAKRTSFPTNRSFWSPTSKRLKSNMAERKDMELFKKVMDEVYGPCEKKTSWKPKPYEDNKNRYLWTDAFGVCNYLTLFLEVHFTLHVDDALLFVVFTLRGSPHICSSIHSEHSTTYADRRTEICG